MIQNKPKGYFEKILAIDCETTGINFVTDNPLKPANPSDGHQAVSWGLIVADATTLKPIEELYIEIKWNEASKAARAADPEWGKGATKIHGLTYQHLEENGLSEEEAVVKIANLIIKYWGPTSAIKALGHNVHMFDIPFLQSLFLRHGIILPVGSRHYDSNSIGFITGAFTSDALFDTMGFDARDSHNALEDTRMALESCRRIKVLWDDYVGVRAYE